MHRPPTSEWLRGSNSGWLKGLICVQLRTQGVLLHSNDVLLHAVEHLGCVCHIRADGQVCQVLHRLSRGRNDHAMHWPPAAMIMPCIAAPRLQ